MPIFYDYCLHVSISFLKRSGYLSPNQWKSGRITWSRVEGERKQITGRIGISVNTQIESPYLELDYTYNGEPINYRVNLISVLSNLRKGKVWFFLCPHTGRRCRKLYCVGEKFLHRQAFKGLYKIQTYSKRLRKEMKVFESMFLLDDILTEIDKPYFRTEYRGKPTKRFQGMIKLAEAIKGISSGGKLYSKCTKPI
jgi:hypothetical protein